MSKDNSAERKSSSSGDQSKKGKGILMYQRKKSRKDNDGHNKKAAPLPSKQQPPAPAKSPEVTVTDWADANSGHLLTCACRVCTGAAPTPLFRSNIIIASPPQQNPLHSRPEPDCPAGGFVPPQQPVLIAPFRTKVSKAKVYPSVVIPPSSKENRKISPPKIDDISFIELLALSGDDLDPRAPSKPAVSFMDMLQNDKLQGKKAADYNLQCFLGSSKMQNALPADNGEGLGELKSKNWFMKMVMEEEGGVDDEELFREVKQELMIREVDAYACLLRKQNLDFGKLITTK